MAGHRGRWRGKWGRRERARAIRCGGTLGGRRRRRDADATAGHRGAPPTSYLIRSTISCVVHDSGIKANIFKGMEALCGGLRMNRQGTSKKGKPKQMDTEATHNWIISQNLSAYRGKWIVVVGRRIVAHGKRLTPLVEGIRRRMPDVVPFVYHVPGDEVIVV